MKEFLSTYIELLQNNHDMVGQVHSEFKRQFLEMTVDKLLEQFVLSKYTGLEKPGKFGGGGRTNGKIEWLKILWPEFIYNSHFHIHMFP